MSELASRPLEPSGGIAPSRPRRALDIAGAVTGLLLLSVPLLLIYLLVRLSSPGPGVFRQTRVGQGGRPFTMYKFRTMREGVGGLTVTANCDPRLTRVGKLLRQWSLDELPQLVNVLRGQMTLVGPRPETYDLAVHYAADCRWVFDHRPGLTGVSEVRLRDFDVLGPDEEVDLDNYITRIVPARVAVDAVYLRDPSMRATFGALWDTVKHILGIPVPPLPPLRRDAAGAEPPVRPAEEPGSAA
ncbi:Sugar transferase involved in LPS biosynthesis (colanic, teichoic acid) [Actinomadura meyerae]|uniref:Sugar transferase involved in LPS biosynthesis (Colanic, teichoic acid) n=1 Tax=Actinomadura meyerae TaxID=240840 RepID=A0A239HYR6_9ACTN|nr:sugar transferase [Actinomadura meyerae]SNS86626.1 Sugar transferase involved in LPS biosynthesis (colanic, teichoic acid) [Actinomadura meyerae]